MHALMQTRAGTAAMIAMNERAAKARASDRLYAASTWDDPEQVDVRRQHAEMRLRRDMVAAVSRGAFAVERAIADRRQSEMWLSLAESNLHSTAKTILEAELDFRRYTSAITNAETAHTEAVAHLAAGFAPVVATL